MKPYPPRPTRQVLEVMTVRLTPSQLDFLASLARTAQTKMSIYLQELIETALEERKHRGSEPNAIQQLQVQSEVMHSGLNSDGFCYYSKH